MKDKILKGRVANVLYKDSYDDDGNKYKKYTFKINGKNATLNAKEDQYISDGDIMIVELNDANEVMSGLLSAKRYQWGKTSFLQNYKEKADVYNIVEGTITEKQKMKMATDVAHDSAEEKANYNIVLTDKNFYVQGYIGEKLMRGNSVAAVVAEQFASVIYDKTNNKWYGVKYPYFIIFIICAITLPLVIFYLHSIGNTLFVNPKGTIIVLDSVFAFFALINCVSYFRTQSAKRFLKQQLGI